MFSKLIEPLLLRAAKTLKISNNLATMLTPDELIDVLNNKIKIAKEELIKRKKGCYFYLYKNKIDFHYEKLEFVKTEHMARKDLVTGNVAHQGKAVGRVKIINKEKDMSKFNKGDILISINTNPSLMPIIDKAAAIVTDEGGVLCHAAIISRELNKPCVIGTEVATEIFKDNDLVEVDAIKGVVKRIK